MKEFPHVNTGEAATREAEAVMAVKAAMHAVCENPIQLHSIVAGGLHHWMVNGARAFAGLAVGDQTLRDMFHYFASRADSDPKGTLDRLLKAQEN